MVINKIEFMVISLHKLADIRTGHTFREKIDEDPKGNVRVIQIKDIKNNATLSEKHLPRIRWITANPKPLKNNDIVMPARGEHYNAAIFEDKKNDNIPVIATNQLFILSTCSDNVTPEYLSWYLNQQLTKHYFKTHRTGTSIPMLNKYSLSALQVPVPPLNIQHKIVAMNNIWLQEKQTTEQLLNNREQMLNGVFQQLLSQPLEIKKGSQNDKK